MVVKSITAMALLIALVTSGVPAYAGTVQMGLATVDEFSVWACGGPMPPDRTRVQSSCGTTKFKECSSCDTLVIRNDSSEVINPQIEIHGLGFDHGDPGLLKLACKKGSGAVDSCYDLAPGQNCFSSIHFCPEQSGLSRGQVKITGGSGSAVKVTIFTIAGRAIYSPQLQAAEVVRRRHLAALMAIPKVQRVSLDQSGGKIWIDVEVEQNHDGSKTAENIKEIQRKVPNKIEGYDVEVTEFMLRGYAS